MVLFGRQLLTFNGQPIGNFGTVFNTSFSINTPKVDLDSVDVIGVLPAAVVYNDRNTGQSLIRSIGPGGISYYEYSLQDSITQNYYWTTNNVLSPIQIGFTNSWAPSNTLMASNTPIQTLACGYGHALVIRNDSTLWGWGFNNAGCLGNGYSGINTSSPVQFGPSGWLQVGCGLYHSLAIQLNGTLWA